MSSKPSLAVDSQSTLLTSEQVARRLGVHAHSVRQYVYRHTLKAKYPGLFEESEVERYAAERRKRK